MSDVFEICDIEEQAALAVEASATMFGIPRLIGPAYHLIMQLMASRGVEMSGAPYTLYRHVDWEMNNKSRGLWGFLRMLFYKFDMEIAIPVAEPMEGEGKVIATSLPAGRYLKTLHRGSYKNMSHTYEDVYAYIIEQGYHPGDFSAEIYLNDPKEVGEEALETEIMVPLV